MNVDDVRDLRSAAVTPAMGLRDAADITSVATPSIDRAIPGWNVTGSLWPQQRYVLRVPGAWNGRLVIAGCPGQRTEFACDRIFADPLLARGFAYACGNKGNGDGVAVLENDARLVVGGVALPRFPLPARRAISFWQHAPGHRIERWLDEMIALARTATETIERLCGRAPELAYAIGLSNGGYQVRRAIEESDLFAGALTWNPVLWSVHDNVLESLHAAVDAMRSGESHRLSALGFPSDVAAASGDGTLYAKYLTSYWYVTLWLHAVHLDPETSIAYGDVIDAAPAESWCARIAQWQPDKSPTIAQRIKAFANTGAIRCKLVEIGSSLDALAPPAIHMLPYERLVEAAGKRGCYRSRIVEQAHHVDAWADDALYPQTRSGYGDVLAAWDELTAWVEGERVKSR